MRMRLALILTLLVFISLPAFSQAPGVPIYTAVGPHEENPEQKAIISRLEELRKEGKLLNMTAVSAQMDKTRAELALPRPHSKTLAPRDIWKAARASYLRIGYYFLCTRCSKWHLNLAGGYVIAEGGVAVTCDHVVRPKGTMKEGYLIAADDDGNVYPVLEVVAANARSDVAIVRTTADRMPPLPLSREVHPGDPVFLFSDPMGNRGYFTEGIVNRFLRDTRGGEEKRVVMDVSADWTPGSSGAALLDDRGNAVGHVSTIAALGTSSRDQAPGQPDEGDTRQHEQGPRTYMVLHHATRAADVLDIVTDKRATAAKPTEERAQ